MAIRRIQLEIDDSGAAPPPIVVVGSMNEAAGLPDDAVIVVPGEFGCEVKLDSDTGPGPVGYGQWNQAVGCRFRVLQQRDPVSDPTLANNPDWAAPELRISTKDGDRTRELRCKLPTAADAELIVGRSRSDADVILEDEHISRKHLRFYLKGGMQMVVDLDSRWGTTLNGDKLLGPAVLKHADVLRIGNSDIEYVCLWDLVPEPALPESSQAPLESSTHDAEDEPSTAATEAPTTDETITTDLASNEPGPPNEDPLSTEAQPAPSKGRAWEWFLILLVVLLVVLGVGYLGWQFIAQRLAEASP